MKLKTLAMIVLVSLSLLANPAHAKRSFGQAITDEAIAFNLNAKFAKDKIVPAKNILVGVHNGVVTLRGELKNQDQINRAVEIAELQKGVKEVKAFLVLKEFGDLRGSQNNASEERSEKKSFFKSLLPSHSTDSSHQIAKGGGRLKETTLHDTNETDSDNQDQ